MNVTEVVQNVASFGSQLRRRGLLKRLGSIGGRLAECEEIVRFLSSAAARLQPIAQTKNRFCVLDLFFQVVPLLTTDANWTNIHLQTILPGY